MDTKAPGRARKKRDRRGRAACPVHYHWLTEYERALLVDGFPVGLPAQVRLLLDEGGWSTSGVASLARLRPFMVRLLARGWRLPVGPGPRRTVRYWASDLVCPGCIAHRRLEREEQQAAEDRRAHREQLRERRRALEEARRLRQEE
ncbi:hypothetical protein [Streptomyces sp. NPDC054863]